MMSGLSLPQFDLSYVTQTHYRQLIVKLPSFSKKTKANIKEELRKWWKKVCKNDLNNFDLL